MAGRSTTLLKDQIKSAAVDTLLKSPSNASPRGIHHSPCVRICVYACVREPFRFITAQGESGKLLYVDAFVWRDGLCEGEISFAFIHFWSSFNSIYFCWVNLIFQRLMDLNWEQKHTHLKKACISLCEALIKVISIVYMAVTQTTHAAHAALFLISSSLSVLSVTTGFSINCLFRWLHAPTPKLWPSIEALHIVMTVRLHMSALSSSLLRFEPVAV